MATKPAGPRTRRDLPAAAPIQFDTGPVQRLRHAYGTGQVDFAAFVERLAVLDADPNADYGDLPTMPARFERGGAPTLRRMDRKLLNVLAKISDPVQRCLNAGATADLAEGASKRARAARNGAMVALHTRYGVAAAQVYTRYGILRRPFHSQILAKHSAVVPVFEDEAAAWAEADREHAIYERERARAETARTVRNAEVCNLTDGRYGAVAQNVELARELSMSTARIAQIRRSRDDQLKAA